MDSLSDRHIVQISNKEETKVYATVLAIPNYRLQATDKTVMTFRERAAGEPEALRAWFYPGRNWGEEFVYPKSKAVAIAKATNTPVLYTPIELPVEVETLKATADEPVLVELKRAPIMAVQPSGAEVTLAEVVTPPPAAELQTVAAAKPSAAAAPQATQAALPGTGSELPLIGLLACSQFLAHSLPAQLPRDGHNLERPLAIAASSIVYHENATAAPNFPALAD